MKYLVKRLTNSMDRSVYYFPSLKISKIITLPLFFRLALIALDLGSKI